MTGQCFVNRVKGQSHHASSLKDKEKDVAIFFTYIAPWSPKIQRHLEKPKSTSICKLFNFCVIITVQCAPYRRFTVVHYTHPNINTYVRTESIPTIKHKQDFHTVSQKTLNIFHLSITLANTVCNSERIIKIGQYLPKLCSNEKRSSFRLAVYTQKKLEFDEHLRKVLILSLLSSTVCLSVNKMH